jgi:mono/diheme cytochrome c family protein
MKKKLFSLPFVILVFFVLSSFNLFAQTTKKTEWEIPEEYKKMKNPIKNSESTIKLGKEQFLRNCATCHGKTGKGDGEKAKSFANITPADLSLNKFSQETDGEHFYKIKIGRNNLHSFKGKVDDEALWSIIHYMKTFKTN